MLRLQLTVFSISHGKCGVLPCVSQRHTRDALLGVIVYVSWRRGWPWSSCRMWHQVDSVQRRWVIRSTAFHDCCHQGGIHFGVYHSGFIA